MMGKQVVLAAEGQGTDPVLDRLAVPLEMSVSEEVIQPVPAAGDVGELFGKAELGRDPYTFRFQLDAERGTNGAAYACRITQHASDWTHTELRRKNMSARN